MILSIDLGGTSIKYGLVNDKGDVSGEGKIVSNNEDYSVYIKDILELVDKFPNAYGIAISAPGGVLSDGTTIGLTAIPCIENQNIKKDIEQVSHKFVTIANDANCTIMSELFDDPLMKIGVGVVIGSGIGGGIYFEDSLLVGKDGISAEFGVNYQLKPNGAIERIALSTVQMEKLHNEKYGKNINAKQIFNNAKQGEKDSTATINEFFKRLAILTLNIESTIHPEKIVFAGGITNDTFFLEKLEEQYSLLGEWVEWDLRVEHKVSKLNKYANLAGAAAYWMQKNKE